jgi:uroporphyrinogen-III synthase
MSALDHVRILITRARGQTSTLAELLKAEGAIPILIPTIELAPPTSWCGLDAALTALRSFDWLLFTSANAVYAFAQRARFLNLPAHPRRIAVIGPATAKAVQEALDQPVDLIPPKYVAESFADALLPHASGASMLLVRAAVARDLLPEALTAAGAAVTIAEAYRSVIPTGSIAELQQLFSTNPPDAITFTSASTAQNLSVLLEAGSLKISPETVLASIGPITSRAMRELGMVPTIEAAESTIPSLVAALTTHFRKS